MNATFLNLLIHHLQLYKNYNKLKFTNICAFQINLINLASRVELMIEHTTSALQIKAQIKGKCNFNFNFVSLSFLFPFNFHFILKLEHENGNVLFSLILVYFLSSYSFPFFFPLSLSFN